MRAFSFLLFFVVVVIIRLFFFFSASLEEGEADFEATLTDSPRFTHVQKFTLLHPSKYKVYITTERFPEYYYGEHVRVKGEIEKTSSEDGRVLYLMSFPHIEKTQRQSILFQVAGFIRERVKSVYQSALPPESASLLLGVVLGIKEGMSNDFSENLSKTGLMHVVAASGMNVTLLAGFIFSTFGKIFSKRKALFLSIITVLFYAVLAGMDASILRASLMASLTFAVALVERKMKVLFTFFTTALFLLLISPQLLFDIGFQLSCAATLGIVLVKPKLPFQTRTQDITSIDVMKEDMLTSISTQITTLPILLFYFHSVGLLTLVSNLLVLWTVAPLMILGGFAAIISLIIPSLASLLALITLPLATFFVFIVNVLGGISPVVTINYISWHMVMGYYLIVCAFLRLRLYVNKTGS